MLMTVSIIMPNYNGAFYMSQSIQSVLDQIYQDWELLIVDDHSTDDSVKVIESFAEKDARIQLLFNKKGSKGAASARNVALKQAKGKYIAFLDNDDIWLKNKLSHQVSVMEQEQMAFSYSWYERFNDKGASLGLHCPEKTEISYNDLIKTNPMGCLTVMYDREQVGLVLMPEVKMRNDYALWLKILKKGFKAQLIPQVLAKYRVRRDSLSGNKLKAAAYQFYFLWKIEGLGFFKTVYCTQFYVVENIMRRLKFMLAK